MRTDATFSNTEAVATQAVAPATLGRRRWQLPLRARLGLQLREAALFIGVTTDDFLRMYYAGELPPARILGRYYLWDREQLEPHVVDRGLVYFVGYGLRVKIGFTRDLPSRIAALQTACPGRLELYTSFRGSPATERALHTEFAADRLHGEWFNLTKGIAKRIRTIRRECLV